MFAKSFSLALNPAPVVESKWRTNMKSLRTRDVLLFLVLLNSSGFASATLIDRGNGLIYDLDRNLTWQRNTNLAATDTFGVAGILGDGRMTWFTAQSWIGAMNAANYLGYNNWRLPIVTDTGQPGCDFSVSGTDCGYNVSTAGSELAHLYHDELGNKAFLDTSGSGPTAGWNGTPSGSFVDGLSGRTVSFHDFVAGRYWSGTEYAPNPGGAWYFSTVFGFQFADVKENPFFVLAVRDGDVASIAMTPTSTPEPGILALMGSGLAGLAWLRRSRTR
jgi:hypothetical protein